MDLDLDPKGVAEAGVSPGVDIVDLGRERAMTRDILTVGAARHTIHGLIELDVGEARDRAEASGLSLTAFLVHCFATALAQEPRLNSVVKGRSLHCFETVNVGTMIERSVGDRKVITGIVVLDAAGKSIGQVSDQIRAAQRRPVGELERESGASLYMHLPGFVRRALLRYMLGRPATAHRMGLVSGVTAVGMFGGGLGWGLPITPCTVAMTIGGIGRRPVVVHGAVVEHDFISITLSFNHDVVDGAPAARFAARLRQLVETADGLAAMAELRPAV